MYLYHKIPVFIFNFNVIALFRSINIVMFCFSFLQCSLYHRQFCAMFIKRAIFNWRHWKLILLQILALLGSLILLSETVTFTHSNDDQARLMSLSQYGQTIVPLSISGNSNLTLIFLKHLKSMLEPDNHMLKEVQGKAHQEKVCS